MKLSSTVLIAPTFLAAASAAQATDYRFHMTIRSDGAPAQQFKLSLPQGESVVVATRTGYLLEFLAPAASSAEKIAIIRLRTGTKESPVTVHETAQSTSRGQESQVAYLVCKGAVRFISPAPEVPVACSE